MCALAELNEVACSWLALAWTGLDQSQRFVLGSSIRRPDAERVAK